MSVSVYEKMPPCVLEEVASNQNGATSYCAGFEFKEWWCEGLANNLMTWITDYALKADELQCIDHTNNLELLLQAAARVYTSDTYKSRGEIGEILCHVICRTYFKTIPVADRVHYKSSSNDPVKGFDLVHIKYNDEGDIQLWLGEAKFYKNRNDGIVAAIKSIESHIANGFLKNTKLLLGPQISKNIPHCDKIREILSSAASLDKFFEHAIFPILIAANSDEIPKYKNICDAYRRSISAEMDALWSKLSESGLLERIKLCLIYVPLGDKDRLACEFDKRLKKFQ